MTKNSTTIMPNAVLFDKQIPVNDIDGFAFKKAILNERVICIINGARVNNPDTKNVTVDVSFRIRDNFEMINPGTSATGKTLSTSPIYDYGNNKKICNVKGKNVTLRFNALKTEEKGVIRVINEHELYNIIATVLKAKHFMEDNEKGSIRTHYTRLSSLLKNGRVVLTSVPIVSGTGTTFEVNAVMEETQ